jgi:hypothetical protein
MSMTEIRALAELRDAAKGAEIRSLVGGIFRLIELALLVTILILIR